MGVPGRQGETHSEPEHRHSDLGTPPAVHRSGPRFQLEKETPVDRGSVATDNGYGEKSY